MKRYSNPLDKISIASSCGANWDEMYGNDRQRFCSHCELNVYNLSDMTQAEAEKFLVNSEGRVCLRVFRRSDGTVLMQDCPVGWQKIKRRVSHMATAVFALFAGFFSGVFAVGMPKLSQSTHPDNKISTPAPKSKEAVSLGGVLTNLPQIKAEILLNKKM